MARGLLSRTLHARPQGSVEEVSGGFQLRKSAAGAAMPKSASVFEIESKLLAREFSSGPPLESVAIFLDTHSSHVARSLLSHARPQGSVGEVSGECRDAEEFLRI